MENEKQQLSSVTFSGLRPPHLALNGDKGVR